MGVSLPLSLHAPSSTWNTAQWAEFAQLFGPVPNTDTIEGWMELVGAQMLNGKTARRAALQVKKKCGTAANFNSTLRFVLCRGTRL